MLGVLLFKKREKKSTLLLFIEANLESSIALKRRDLKKRKEGKEEMSRRRKRIQRNAPALHAEGLSQSNSFLLFASSTLLSQSVLIKNVTSTPATRANATATPVHKPAMPHPSPNAVPKLIGIATI